MFNMLSWLFSQMHGRRNPYRPCKRLMYYYLGPYYHDRKKKVLNKTGHPPKRTIVIFLQKKNRFSEWMLPSNSQRIEKAHDQKKFVQVIGTLASLIREFWLILKFSWNCFCCILLTWKIWNYWRCQDCAGIDDDQCCLERMRSHLDVLDVIRLGWGRLANNRSFPSSNPDLTFDRDAFFSRYSQREKPSQDSLVQPFETTATATVCGSSKLVNFVLFQFPEDFNDRLCRLCFSFTKARLFLLPMKKSFSLQWQSKNRKFCWNNGVEEIRKDGNGNQSPRTNLKLQ